MSTISLNSRIGLASLNESQQLLRRFRLDKHTLASPTATNRFVRKALNGPSGLRYIDTSTSFKLVQHALGSATERTFGLIGSSQPTLDAIAECVNAELDAFVCGRKSHSVRIFHHDYGNETIRLIPATGKSALFTRLVGNATLLMPTGMSSSEEAGGEDVYLRLDVVRSKRSGSLMTAHEFLFTNSAGKSIAGLGDIPDFIVNIDDANDALKEVLGVGYDVADCNARIFDAWWLHKRLGNDSDSITIPLAAGNLTGSETTMVLRWCSSTAWEVLLDDGTGARPLVAYIPAVDVEIDTKSLMSECDRIETILSEQDDVVSVTNFEHIFGDHLDRFPEEFREMFRSDYEEAVERFIEELERSKTVPSEWQPVPYHCGNEKTLELNGDEASTRIQLLLPLYLAGNDRNHLKAPVFAVVGLKRDPVTHEISCFIPTILGRRLARANIRSFRRMIRRAYTNHHWGLVA